MTHRYITHVCSTLLLLTLSIALHAQRPEGRVVPEEDREAPVTLLPEFPGGEESLAKFIRKNLKFPKKARKSRIEGTVYIEFVVETDGSITNAQVKQGTPGGPELEEEALRLVSLLPHFQPGTYNSKPVRTRYTLPVKFRRSGRD